MGAPYIGEIRMFAGSFAPDGWAFCDGTLLSISEYETLFQLLGTTYGGDGQATFGLPDLRGRAAIGVGTGPGLSTYVLAEQGGVEEVTLTMQQLPTHRLPGSTTEMRTRTHPQAGSSLATGGAYAGTPDTTMGPAVGGQPHENMPPYLVVCFIISLFGIFPSPT
jgi:microcystin-dependent protein